MKQASARRSIPSVDKVMRRLGSSPLPRPILVGVVRDELSKIRDSGGIVPDFDEIIDGVRRELNRLNRSRLQPVINGTGIVLHTNLGRAPLGSEAAAAVHAIALEYSNLELNLDEGTRGGRSDYLERCVAEICRSEGAAVVNNCAAALVLILRTLTLDRKEVIISRGELVQIGGGFRVPEILESSGATLREVGTTNLTTTEDYRRAIGERTGLILKVHRSNFFMDGFVGAPTTRDLAELASSHGLPFVEDLGSGAILSGTDDRDACAGEPTAAQIIGDGADLVCFSGDKLFGAAQAGLIAGRVDLIHRLKNDPLFRAFRCGKMVIAALQSVTEGYLSGTGPAVDLIPTHRMLKQTRDQLHERARSLVDRIKSAGFTKVTVADGASRVGGGSVPKASIPTQTIDLELSQTRLGSFARLLRESTPPLIGYIDEGRFRIDLRTVFPAQDEWLPDLIIRALESVGAIGGRHSTKAEETDHGPSL